MKRPKLKRNFWRSNEVRCMLGVFKDFNIVQLLEQKTVPINDIYKRVEIEMGQRGFSSKNGKQIQSKWSQMKSAYICIKRNHKADFYKMKDPEFRDEVAELVEVDMSVQVSLPPLPPGVCFSPSQSVDESHDVNDSGLVDESMDEEDDLMPDVTQEVPEEKPCSIDEAVEEPMVQKVTEEDPTHRQGSYRKSFTKFMDQLRAMEVDLQEEFIMKQTRLLAEERRLQIQRDNLIIATFAANTNQILKQTQELIEKGFKPIDH